MEPIRSKLDEVQSFFVNPLTTPIGHKIDLCTNPSALSNGEDWALLLEICDMLNDPHDHENTLKYFLKVVKKKLNCKNYPTIRLTLILVETCVKNCAQDGKFRKAVLNREFLNELLKIIAPKNDPPQNIQDQVLSLIQNWAEAFNDNEEVVNVYEELKEKGIEFPARNLDFMAPILMKTPPTSAPEEPVFHAVNITTKPNQTQLTKIRTDLNIVQSNLTVFNEILSDFSPQDEEFLQQLHSTCKEMQARLGNLISEISDDDQVVTELLTVNDEINNVFLRYQRHLKNTTKQTSTTSTPATEKPLIDFDYPTSTKESGAIPKTSINPIVPEPVIPREFTEEDLAILQNHTESDFSEMEDWLEKNSSDNQTLSSREFDKFLEERAKKK